MGVATFLRPGRLCRPCGAILMEGSGGKDSQGVRWASESNLFARFHLRGCARGGPVSRFSLLFILCPHAKASFLPVVPAPVCIR